MNYGDFQQKELSSDVRTRIKDLGKYALCEKFLAIKCNSLCHPYYESHFSMWCLATERTGGNKMK